MPHDSARTTPHRTTLPLVITVSTNVGTNCSRFVHSLAGLRGIPVFTGVATLPQADVGRGVTGRGVGRGGPSDSVPVPVPVLTDAALNVLCCDAMGDFNAMAHLDDSLSCLSIDPGESPVRRRAELILSTNLWY